MHARTAALVGVFASLHVILYFMSFGLWRNWAIYLEPVEGIILGPWAGFLAALIGSIVARAVKPVDFWMFGIIAEPLGVLAAGFLAKGDWKPVLAIYGVMLSAYFIHPLSWQLPLWAILDILIAPALIYPTAKMGKSLFEGNFKHITTLIILISFTSTVTLSLIHIS
ncbi:MAG: hypothetical protein N3E47_00805, partial [Candidatus Bathyarchaeota archaeon]|nr:hypothetical protein [Candidatus Bathyarchaeota archaeon]